MAKRQTQKEIVDELTERMNEGIKSYKNDPSEELKLLNFMNRFNNYSVRNITLIQKQFGNALGVASYKQHQVNGYQVQKGEKAIRILAPKFQKMFQDNNRQWHFLNQASAEQKAKIKAGELKVEDRLAGFLSVPVFDITQTNCPEQDYPKLYPNKPENFTFDGTEKDIDNLKTVLINFANEKNVNVTFDKTNSTSKGYYVPATNNIVIQDNMNIVEQVKVLLHELAHAEMHNIQKLSSKSKEQTNASVLEYQAEMTAYVTSSTLGIDSEDYSTKYLAGWTKRNVDDDVYIKSLEEVKKVSTDFIHDISDRYHRLTNELSLEKIDSFAEVLNSFKEYEYGINHSLEDTIHEIEKNGYHATIGFVEDDDRSFNLVFNREISYDLKNERQINNLSNGFITLESSYPYAIEDCISDLQKVSFDEFFNTSTSFDISLDDVASIIQLTALTDSSEYLEKFIAENQLDLIQLDLERINENKNDLLKNLDSETIEFFNAYGVEVPDSFIFDHEFQDIINFQLSPYQSIETVEHGEIIFTSDTDRSNEVESFSNYKDLWEKHFKDELSNDLNSYSLKDLQQNEFLSNSPTLLSRLALLDDRAGQSLVTLKQEVNSIKELDLDNDGVPDRIDPDDTRSVIRTEADKSLVANKTDKFQEEERKVKTRNRTL